MRNGQEFGGGDGDGGGGGGGDGGGDRTVFSSVS